MVSLRHVEKKKQERPKGKSQGQQGGASGGGPTAGTQAAAGGSQSQSNGKDHKHEGETVNTEIRATKKKIEILDGETVVAVYSKENKSWTFKTDTITVEAKNKLTLKCSNGETDIWGKPIKFNGGGPSVQPFTIPG